MSIVRYAALLAVLVLTACESFTAPEGAEPFAPPPIYRTWWAEMETCSRLSGNFERIRWYTVPDDALGGEYDGLWHEPHDIFLSEYVVNIRHIPAHEMLHDLRQQDDHPAVFDTCGVR